MPPKSISAWIKDRSHLPEITRTGHDHAEVETGAGEHQQSHSKGQSAAQGAEDKINWQPDKGASGGNRVSAGQDQGARARERASREIHEQAESVHQDP